MHSKIVQIILKMFNMSSIVFDTYYNSYLTFQLNATKNYHYILYPYVNIDIVCYEIFMLYKIMY